MINQQSVLPNGGVDPNVKIPAAVLAGAARSDEIHKAAYQTTIEDAPASAENQPANIALTEAPAATQPVQQAEPAPAPATPQVTDPADDDLSWRHKFLAENGRLKKALENVRQLSEQVQNMTATMAALHQAPPAQQIAPELNAQSLLTPQEVEEYGPEFLEVVGKKAAEIARRELAQRDAEISRLRAQVDGVQTSVSMDARSKMKQELAARLPNWEQVNQDERFLDWLALPDPFSGAIRHSLLKEAWGRNETARVLAFFNGFLSEEAAVVPRAEPAPSPKGKVPLETLAAPGRAKTAASTTGPAEKPVITPEQITQHYARSAAGYYRGREAEYQQMEQAIADAVREGRIRRG
jgi:hypothetical protein